MILYTQIIISNIAPEDTPTNPHTDEPIINNYTIHFPSGFQFMMNLPSEITVHEITQIIRSYSALHNAYGLKQEGRVLQPRYLESLDNNILVDAYLIDNGDEDRQLGPLGNISFKIVYGLKDKMGEDDKDGVCAFRKYQFIGKLSSNTQNEKGEQFQIFIARNRNSCHIHSITSIPKKNLNFPKIQTLIQKINISKSTSFSTSSNLTTNFQPVYEVFQTQNTICMISEYFPFQLDRVSIDNKYLMDTILSQIAKILHVRSRTCIGSREVRLSQFRMGFDFRVVYCGIDLETEQVCIGQGNEKNNEFGANMCRIFEEQLKNCSVRVMELYIPLLHWLKNKRIITYIDFLKYSQITPASIQQPENVDKRKLILSSLIQNYKLSPITNLTASEVKQFSTVYRPKTNIFRVLPIQNQIYSPNKKVPNKENPQLSELLQNISTIKKRKQHIQISPKPLYEVFLKRNKLKNKTKNKAKAKSLIQNLTDNPRKTSKNKKHDRKISEFLIDD